MFKEVLSFTVLLGLVNGHGFLWNPPGRGTAGFRGFNEFPLNYNHMENFCGGYEVHWERNGGQCGVCGDPYDEQQPRSHEVGGTYGPVNRRVTGTYQSGSVINIGVNLTAYHRGLFTFRLCINNDFSTEVTQDCLDQNLLIVDGTDSPFFDINEGANRLADGTGYYTIPLQLPAGVVASQAVLQWNYTTGNSWRSWPPEAGCLGCGPQETFINCADIAIVAGETTSAISTTTLSTNSTTSVLTSTSQSTTMSVLTGSTSATMNSTSMTSTTTNSTSATSPTTPFSTSNSTTSPVTTISTSTTSQPTTNSTRATTSTFSTTPSTTATSSTTNTTLTTTTAFPTTKNSISTTISSTITSSSTLSPTTSTLHSTSTSSTSTIPTTTTSSTTNSNTSASTSSTESQTCTIICYTSDACSCSGAGAYENTQGIDTWCWNNCRAGYCPSTHCKCLCN